MMLNSILIVDDARIVRTILSEIISLYFPQIKTITEAPNGETAIQLMQKNHYDLVFLDLHMPKLDGIESLKIIKETFRENHPPIIIISADGSEKKLVECQRLGVKHYLRKPFSPEQVAGLISLYQQPGLNHEYRSS